MTSLPPGTGGSDEPPSSPLGTPAAGSRVEEGPVPD